MKKFAIIYAAAVAATALMAAPVAHAGQFNQNMKLSNGPGPGPNPHGPKPGLSSHGHGFHNHHHWGAVGLGVGLMSAAAMAADSDCFYIRRKMFVPGVGIVKRRELVCS
jgi:hypothetical protein